MGVLFTVAWTFRVGQDIGWDIRNYHYYTAYAWLSGRVTYHIAPAQIQTWLNPLVYVPYYLLIRHLPPVIAGAALGAIGAVNLVLVYVLARRVIAGASRLPAIPLAVFAMIVGSWDANFLTELGRTSSDIAVSIPVLASLVALCSAHGPAAGPREQRYGYALCGLLLGGACGLKLTCVIFAAALTLTLVVLAPVLRFEVSRFGWYALGGTLGFLLTGGYWSWFLWEQYRNPVFPYFNDLFRSPWALPHPFRDLRFVPQSIWEGVSLPFRWFAGGDLHPEYPLRDPRFAILLVGIAVTLPLALLRAIRAWPARAPHPDPGYMAQREHFWLLVIFSAFSYLLWMGMFGIHRYLMPLGLMAGVIIFLLLDRIVPSRSVKFAFFAMLTLFVLHWTRSNKSERISYGADWFGVQPVAAIAAPDTLFVMLQDAPTSYILPVFPESARFIRLSGNFPLSLDTALGRQALDRIANHRGPIRSLATSSPLNDADRSQLARFGLALDEADCVAFSSRADQFMSCAVKRETTPPAGP